MNEELARLCEALWGVSYTTYAVPASDTKGVVCVVCNKPSVEDAYLLQSGGADVARVGSDCGMCPECVGSLEMEGEEVGGVF